MFGLLLTPAMAAAAMAVSTRQRGHQQPAAPEGLMHTPTPGHDTPSDERFAPCACARPGDGTHAVAVDPEIKRAALTRLRRIEGQVRGPAEDGGGGALLRRRADPGVVGAGGAARGGAGRCFRNHLEHCAAERDPVGRPEQAGAMYDELVELVYRGAGGRRDGTALRPLPRAPPRRPDASPSSSPPRSMSRSTVRTPSRAPAAGDRPPPAAEDRAVEPEPVATAMPTSGSAIASPARWMKSR